MRIVFMGTPDFSVPALRALVEAGHQVTAVVTQPDKPKGRGKDVQMTPVKIQALEYGIPVYQPVKVKTPEFVEVLKKEAPDAIVVIAFGQILSKEILDLPKYGCVNIHASLLPKYRGAAPIQWAVIDGEKETGVTTMMMDVGLDTGDILETKVIPLDPKETSGSLFEKLSKAGGPLILSTLEKLEKGTITRTPQGESGTSYAKMLTKTLGDINWTMSATAIERLIRGLNPWPSAYTFYNGKTLKIWDADVLEEAVPTDAVPGQVLQADKHGFTVAAGEGILKINELQLEGKKRMAADALLRGFTITPGEILGHQE